jgi:hypothetical protein
VNVVDGNIIPIGIGKGNPFASFAKRIKAIRH